MYAYDCKHPAFGQYFELSTKNSCTLEVGGQISTHFLTVNLYSPPVHH